MPATPAAGPGFAGLPAQAPTSSLPGFEGPPSRLGVRRPAWVVRTELWPQGVCELFVRVADYCTVGSVPLKSGAEERVKLARCLQAPGALLSRTLSPSRLREDSCACLANPVMVASQAAASSEAGRPDGDDSFSHRPVSLDPATSVESNVRRERRKRPDPPCTICKGTGTINCRNCFGRGRVNHVDLAVLPKGEWPQWCQICGGSGLDYCHRCHGTGEYREPMGFHFTVNRK